MKNLTELLNDYLNSEIKNLDRGIIATPKNFEHLQDFAKANHGSMDIVLMHMAINYGYNLALENVAIELGKIDNVVNK